MSNTNSKYKWLIILMRWIARLVSIPWAYCALGLVWFIAGVGLEEGMPLALNIIIVFTAFLLTLGAAILAGVWQMELLGGRVLLADSLLLFIWFAVVPQLPDGLIPILILPPLVAGALFLACHRMSKSHGSSTFYCSDPAPNPATSSGQISNTHPKSSNEVQG